MTNPRIQVLNCGGRILGSTLEKYKSFWNRQNTDRPLFGCIIGLFVSQQFPRTMQAIPAGIVKPEDIHIDLFLEDCEHLYQTYMEIDDDYPFVAVPFYGIPWLEAIMGCPVISSPTSFWAETCVKDWDAWHWERPTLENPWAKKLLELIQALREHAKDRFPIAPTLMRGPSDMLSAMRGPAQLPFDLIDHPETIKHAAKMCTDVWIEVGKAQLTLIPDSHEGYMAGHAFRTWIPEKGIWFQEDALALLSPNLYRKFFSPMDKHIAKEFFCTAFHLHSTALWAIDQLIQIPEIDILQTGIEELQDKHTLEEIFCAGKKILAHKPLIMTMTYRDESFSLLERILTEFPPEGLSIQVVVKDIEEAKKVKEEFFEVVRKVR